jgi:tetratricopeptide (TPR) repeat protein
MSSAALFLAMACHALTPSSGAWQAVEAQYARIAEASRTKNIDALASIYDPAFHVTGPNDAHLDYKQSLDYSRAAFRVMREQIHLTNTILRLEACSDDTVTATVLQQWSRWQVAFGKPRRFDTAAVQDETWVRRADGWKRLTINNVHPGAWYIDDKRVNPAKPYDPEAPAFDPDDPHPKQSVAAALFDIVNAKGPAAARPELERLRASDRYCVSEQELNATGYKLLAAKKVPEAIAVFELNVSLYPSSANVYDSLGEAYMTHGDRAQATANYRKSLQLDPANENAKAMLKRLGATE